MSVVMLRDKSTHWPDKGVAKMFSLATLAASGGLTLKEF
jgi:hypothetical protein